MSRGSFGGHDAGDYLWLVENLDLIEDQMVRDRVGLARFESAGLWVACGPETVPGILQDEDSFSVSGLQINRYSYTPQALARLGRIPLPSEDDARQGERLLEMKSTVLRAQETRDLHTLAVQRAEFHLDRCVTAGGDLMTDVARLVPAEIVCTILEVELDLAQKLTAWAESRAMVTWGAVGTQFEEGHVDNTVEFWDFCEDLARSARRRRTGALGGIAENGGSDYELARLAYWLVFASLIAVPGLIGNCVFSRLGVAGEVTRRPFSASVTKQELRACTSIVATLRYASRATEVSSFSVPAGSSVLTLLRSVGAAEGSPARLVNFGVGAHACLGQALAVAEVNAVFAAIDRSYPYIRVREGFDVQYVRTLTTKWPARIQIDV